MAESEDTPSLVAIQKLQFRDRAQAESRLFALLAPDLRGLERVTINTKAESLNSINGFLTLSGEEYFFKSHTEEHETHPGQEQERLLYNTALLEKAGYPVVMPELVQAVPGKQIAIYRKVELETLFDLAKQAEDEALATPAPSLLGQKLADAQAALDTTLLGLYEKTLESPAQPTISAPIHQLFSERLLPGHRVDDFYAGARVNLPGGPVPFEQLAGLRWTINGVSYGESLGSLIERSRRLLAPDRPTVKVCGHGDAHNGNVWVDRRDMGLAYFDAAFAGFHDPLLDVVKPLFHNVFARWMYFPDEVTREFEVDYKISGGAIEVSHSYRPSALRRAFFASKIENVVAPLVQRLRSAGLLPGDWRTTLRSGLFCCPFLTVNLAAAHDPRGKLDARYSPAIRLLGLSLAVEMGSDASNDATTSEVRNHLERLPR